MANIERVKQGLKHCSDRSRCNDRCPYSNIIKDQNEGMDSCVTQLAADALSVIEEQEKTIAELTEKYKKTLSKAFLINPLSQWAHPNQQAPPTSSTLQKPHLKNQGPC